MLARGQRSSDVETVAESQHESNNDLYVQRQLHQSGARGHGEEDEENPTSLPTVATSTRSLVPWSLRRRKKSVETPTTNMARVASMNGAPSIAPIPISAPSSDASPVRTGSRMATMAIMLSGKAVPTAARRLPTAPWRIPSLPPSISTAFVKNAAPSRIAISAATNSTVVNIAHLLSDGPRNAKKRAIAACLPADGLARCASAPVTGREPRSVLTTGPPATAGGYSPIACDFTRRISYRQRNGDLVPAALYAGPKKS